MKWHPMVTSLDGKGSTSGNHRRGSMDPLSSNRDVPRETQAMRQGRVTLLMPTETKCSCPVETVLLVRTMKKCFAVWLPDDVPAKRGDKLNQDNLLCNQSIDSGSTFATSSVKEELSLDVVAVFFGQR